MSTTSLPFEKGIRHFMLFNAVNGTLAPSLPVLTGAATGGTLAASAYFYKVSAISAAGESEASAEATITTTGATSTVTVNWTAVAGATSYKIYRGTVAGGQNVFYTSTTNSFTDTGAAGTAGTTVVKSSSNFISTGANGDMIVLGEDGLGWSAGKDLLFLKKDASGALRKSDLITPKDISYMKGTSPRAKKGRTQTAKVESSIVAGTHYMLDFKLHYATSEENFMSFHVSVKAVTGDTATTLATKLGVELASQFDRSIHVGYQGGKGKEVMITGTQVAVNKYFKITQSAGVLTVTEKDFVLTDYVVGLRAFDSLMWNMVPKTDIDDFATASVILTSVITPGVFAKGAGYQIKELEHYLGNHLGGGYGSPDITLGFNNEYEASTAKSYYTIDLKYTDISRYDVQQSHKQLMLVSESMAEINKVGAAIAAAGGPAWINFVAATV